MSGLTLLGVSMTTAWVTFILLGAWLTEYLRVERQSVLWLSAALTGINVAGSGIGRVVGGMVTKQGRERLAIIWFYGLVTVLAVCMFFPAPLTVILTLAFFVVAVTSMGFAPTVRLTHQIAGSGLQGTAMGYVLTLGMVFGSLFPPLFGWLVEISGSFLMGFLVVVACPLAGFLAMLRFHSRTESR